MAIGTPSTGIRPTGIRLPLWWAVLHDRRDCSLRTGLQWGNCILRSGRDIGGRSGCQEETLASYGCALNFLPSSLQMRRMIVFPELALEVRDDTTVAHTPTK